MTSEKYIELNLAVHGFHCFCKYWWSKACEKLLNSHEKDSILDMFKIETSLENSQVVGNATRDGLRICKSLWDGGASMNTELTTTTYRYSLLLKDGLGISHKIIVKVTSAVKNTETLKKCELFEKLYSKSKCPEIFGSILIGDITCREKAEIQSPWKRSK